MISFEFLNTCGAPVDSYHIQVGIERASAKLNITDLRFVSIECVSEDDIQKLNQELRHHNESTDIISIASIETEAGEQHITIGSKGELSFELHENKPLNPLPTLGQLVICWDVICRNAAAAGQPPEAELEWVIEHGVYHLMGFHHTHD